MNPIEYCSKLNNKDASSVQMHWTQISDLRQMFDIFCNNC